MPTANPSDLLDKAPPRLRDPLLQPFRLKGLSLRNRIMSTSHAATIDEGGLPKERYQRYHEEKAKGGIALTMFGGYELVADRGAQRDPRAPPSRHPARDGPQRHRPHHRRLRRRRGALQGRRARRLRDRDRWP